jgi:hypothetical protein
MTNQEFRDWLRGFFELSDENVCLAPQQVQIIVNHLNLAEAVEGKLDETNRQLRADIDAFRDQPSRTPEDFQSLTFSLRQHLQP